MENVEAILLDTSLWVDLLQHDDPRLHARLEKETRPLATSSLVVAELQALSVQGHIGPGLLDDVQAYAHVEPLLASDAIEGGRLHGVLRRKGVRKVGLVDTLILATARRIGATLLTRDHDLAGQRNVEVFR